jgi:nucleoside-diphosphate-sugar epimerase
VYGPGRDQGLTAEPTHAMRAAAQGEPYLITFGGRTELHYAPDVARALVLAARSQGGSADVYDMPGESVHMSEVVSAIEAAEPGADVTHGDETLPFPDELPGRRFPAPVTPLTDGVAETIEHFRRLTRPVIPA